MNPAGKVMYTLLIELSTVNGFPVKPNPSEIGAPSGAVHLYEVAFGNL